MARIVGGAFCSREPGKLPKTCVGCPLRARAGQSAQHQPQGGGAKHNGSQASCFARRPAGRGAWPTLAGWRQLGAVFCAPTLRPVPAHLGHCSHRMDRARASARHNYCCQLGAVFGWPASQELEAAASRRVGADPYQRPQCASQKVALSRTELADSEISSVNFCPAELTAGWSDNPAARAAGCSFSRFGTGALSLSLKLETSAIFQASALSARNSLKSKTIAACFCQDIGKTVRRGPRGGKRATGSGIGLVFREPAARSTKGGARHPSGCTCALVARNKRPPRRLTRTWLRVQVNAAIRELFGSIRATALLAGWQ